MKEYPYHWVPRTEDYGVDRPIYLLNGPPRSGKDWLANQCVTEINAARKWRAAKLKIADQLKYDTHRAYSLRRNGEVLPSDALEDVKDKYMPAFRSTPREAYIRRSETVIKPAHGPRAYGYAFANRLADCSFDCVFVADSGFVEEAEAIRDRFRCVYQVVVTRPGTDFSSDSRSHWYSPLIPRLVLVNDGVDSVWPLINHAVAAMEGTEARRAEMGPVYLSEGVSNGHG